MAAAKFELCQKSVYYMIIAILLTNLQSINVRNDKIDVKHLEIAIEITAVLRNLPKSTGYTPKRFSALNTLSDFCRGTLAIKFVRDALVVHALVVCGDVAVNPGPSCLNLICQTCLKTVKKNQATAICSMCMADHHLRCLGEDFLNNKTLCNLQFGIFYTCI